MTGVLVGVASVAGYGVVMAAVCMFFRAAARLDRAHRLQPETVPDFVPAEWSEVRP